MDIYKIAQKQTRFIFRRRYYPRDVNAELHRDVFGGLGQGSGVVLFLLVIL